MHVITLLALCCLLLVGCTTNSKQAVDISGRQRVIDALAKTRGKEQARRDYESWMAEVREGEHTSDDEGIHRRMLAVLDHFEKLAAGMKQHADQTKNRLLHETDHQAVLLASREVIRTRHEYEHDPAVFPGSRPEMSFIAGDDPKLPIAIRELRAPRLIVLEDCVVIEFGGGFHHQGLMALAKDGEAMTPDQKGRLQLIDGLWFYEDTH